jgi:hypothetical protein
VSIKDVEEKEIAHAKKIQQIMNFDNRFKLAIDYLCLEAAFQFLLKYEIIRSDI